MKTRLVNTAVGESFRVAENREKSTKTMAAQTNRTHPRGLQILSGNYTWAMRRLGRARLCLPSLRCALRYMLAKQQFDSALKPFSRIFLRAKVQSEKAGTVSKRVR